MKWRGVKEPQTSMVNSVVRGDFRHDPSLKAEFFELVKQQESMLYLAWLCGRSSPSAGRLILILSMALMVGNSP
jgi:hypothetical protein